MFATDSTENHKALLRQARAENEVTKTVKVTSLHNSQREPGRRSRIHRARGNLEKVDSPEDPTFVPQRRGTSKNIQVARHRGRR